jgi:hypothetical protein
MSIHTAIRYRGFILDCEPVRKDDHSYVAQVTISREAGQAMDEHVFPELYVTDSAPVAVSYAKTWGRHWVDEHS